MSIEHLTTLIYSEDTRGPWQLYTFGSDGYHSGGQWFGRAITHPDEMIDIATARNWAEASIARRMEVRVCDVGDMLVFHSKDGATLYGAGFWDAITT